MLSEYVINHCERGACMCGRCCDAPDNPEFVQPSGKHTEDLVFFKIKAINNPVKKEFIEIAKNEFPQWFDGNEHSYLEIGCDIGDQGIALMTMGLGSILECWTLLTPKNMMPFLPDDMIKQMAGQGMITITNKQPA